MICKVQRPLFPDDGPWLVYDEQRRFHVEVPVADVPRKLRQAMGTLSKIYCNLGVDRNTGALAFHGVVMDQSW